ncbi:hypothetical protein BH11ARM2_BH11ARM2_28780 [soil metagenome]
MLDLFDEEEETPPLPVPASGPAPYPPEPPHLPDVPGIGELAVAVREWIHTWLAEGRPDAEFLDRDLDALLRRARQGAGEDGPNEWRFVQALTVHATVSRTRHGDEATEILRAQTAFLNGEAD